MFLFLNHVACILAAALAAHQNTAVDKLSEQDCSSNKNTLVEAESQLCKFI